MAGAHILVRVRLPDGRWVAASTANGDGGERRYLVRWRTGGRSSRLRHGGSFRTRREAEARLRYLRDELAAGRVPDRNPGAAAEADPRLIDLIDDQIAARVDVADATREGYRYAAARLPPRIAQLPAAEVRSADLQGWIAAALAGGLGPPSIEDTVGIVRAAYRRAGIEPNPAASDRLTLPRNLAPEVRPPSAEEILRLVALLGEPWDRAVLLLEASGLRVGELAAALGRDLDRAGSRLLVRRERTKQTGSRAGERWVPLRPAALALLPERPAPERPLIRLNAHSFRDRIRVVLARDGRPRLNPHALRHRYASRLVAQGLPITIVRERLGHARASMTLDVYSHVLIDDGLDPSIDVADLLA
jgi:integrase